MRRVLMTMALLLVSVPALAQTGPVGSGLAWDQAASDLAEAQSYHYRASFDDGAFATTTATCSGSSSPFSCAIALPLQVGSHTARVSAARVVNGQESEQAISPVFSFTLTPQATTPPGNLRLVPPDVPTVAVLGTVRQRGPAFGLDVATTTLDAFPGVRFYLGGDTLTVPGVYAVAPGDRFVLQLWRP